METMEMLEDAFFDILLSRMALAAALSFAAYALRSAGHWIALSRVRYPYPFLPMLPFCREWAVASAAIGPGDSMYAFGARVPAGLAKAHGIVSTLLALIPVIGWIASLAMRLGVGGPCYAWLFASLEGRTERDCSAKGYVSALFPTIGAIMLLAASSGPRRKAP